MYSEQQKIQARETDMIDFLQKFEGFTFKRAGREYHCHEHSSLVVMNDRKGWYWNSQDIGGANAIDYCIKIRGMKFSEAMNAIVGMPDVQFTKAPSTPLVTTHEEKELQLPEKVSGRYSRAFAYLTQTRMLDSNIVSELMSKHYIYQDTHNNVVFVGYDDDEKARFACVRGTLTIPGKPAFRGDCSGSDKRYAFKIDGTDDSKVYVFEAPIDAISHATLANLALKDAEAWRKHSRICLSGKSDLALDHYLKTHPACKQIILCLDDDKNAERNWGQEKAQSLKEQYVAKGYDVRINKPRYNDYNDDLIAYKQASSQNQEKSAKENCNRETSFHR